MSPQAVALLLAGLAILGTGASLLAPTLAPTYPRLAVALRVVAALAVDLRGALAAGRLTMGETPRPPGAP